MLRFSQPTERLRFNDRDDADAPAALIEIDFAGHEREKGVVLGSANVSARVKLGAALADDDGAGRHEFAAESLDAQSLGI